MKNSEKRSQALEPIGAMTKTAFTAPPELTLISFDLSAVADRDHGTRDTIARCLVEYESGRMSTIRLPGMTDGGVLRAVSSWRAW